MHAGKEQHIGDVYVVFFAKDPSSRCTDYGYAASVDPGPLGGDKDTAGCMRVTRCCRARKHPHDDTLCRLHKVHRGHLEPLSPNGQFSLLKR